MKNEYLGDGLYASYDGHQICLRANGSTEETATDTVYLDPDVYHSLLAFVARATAVEIESPCDVTE